MDDEKACVAPELCIRCRSSRDYCVEVVFNTDACTCSDEEVCLHSKTVRKKKFVFIVFVFNNIWKVIEMLRRLSTTGVFFLTLY